MIGSRQHSAVPPWLLASLTVALCVLPSSAALAQENGAIRGVVAEEETWRLIESAKVTVVGTALETTTGPDGTFLFPDVPMGLVLVRVEAKGFPSVVEEVEVTPGNVPVPVFLQSAVAALEGILVFGTRTDRAASRVNRTAADLVADKVPSIRPILARTTDSRTAPTTFSMRGRNNLGSGSGEPLIIVDGVRMTGGVGSALRALQRLPAADVASIQVLRGATAGFVYGAPDGVIIIETAAKTGDR